MPAGRSQSGCQNEQGHHDRRHGREHEVSPPDDDFFLRRLFGNDLFLQSGGHRDLPELRAQNLLPGAMFAKPARQFRVPFRQRQRLGDLRIGGVRRAGAVEQQNVFGVVAIHKSGWREGELVAVPPVSSWCSRSRPRARRDLTVPMRHFQDFGNFEVGIILQIKQGDRRPVNFVQARQGREHLRGVELVE